MLFGVDLVIALYLGFDYYGVFCFVYMFKTCSAGLLWFASWLGVCGLLVFKLVI